MTEQTTPSNSGGSKAALYAVGGFLLLCLAAASLPFWLGPAYQVLSAWLERGSGQLLYAVSLTVAASLAAGASFYVLWLGEKGAFSEKWNAHGWLSVYRLGRATPFVLLFGVYLLLIWFRPAGVVLMAMMSVAGGAPRDLVGVCAYGLVTLWHVPIALGALAFLAGNWPEDF